MERRGFIGSILTFLGIGTAGVAASVIAAKARYPDKGLSPEQESSPVAVKSQVPSANNTYHQFVERMCSAYEEFDIQNDGIVLETHEPRKLQFGWVFIAPDHSKYVHIVVPLTTVSYANQVLKNHEGYLARSIIENIHNGHSLCLNKNWLRSIIPTYLKGHEYA